MSGYIGILLLPVAFVILLLSLKNGGLKNKIISIVLFILLPITAYVWFDSGLALKNSEEYFVQRGDGQYAEYTESDKHNKLIELKNEDANNKLIFNVTGIGFWIILSGLVLVNIENIKKKRKSI
jgi:hypothetical protein